MGLLGDAYAWVKAAHIIFVIFWMAGLFMLPRYLVYHQEAGLDTPEAARWVEREGKLRQIILTPSLILVWVLGALLAVNLGLMNGQPGLGWLHAKIGAVLLLSGVHGYLAGAVRKFAEDRNEKSARHWRIVNEIPTLLMIAIVILVVVKPF